MWKDKEDNKDEKKKGRIEDIVYRIIINIIRCGRNKAKPSWKLLDFKDTYANWAFRLSLRRS